MTVVHATLPQSLPTEGELWRRLRENGDTDARQQLLDHFLPYARVVAATYYSRRIVDDIGFDDYHQLACMGLIESIDRYDPQAGAQFKTFAARRMHGAILDGLENATEKHQQIAAEQRLKRERLASIKAEAAERSGIDAFERRRNGPTAAHADALFKFLSEVGLGLAISYLLDGTGMVAPDSQAAPLQAENLYYQRTELSQLRQRIRELVRQLSDQERSVITRHYLHHHSLDDIAVHLQLTKGRISQIHRAALRSMRAQLGRQRRCDVDL
jgi:RNA polymerase sigma factor for flagellar operon FliA